MKTNNKKDPLEALEYDERLAYTGMAEWLEVKKIKLALFDRSTIDLGRKAKEKWRKIAAGEASDDGISDCSYCMRFYKTSEELGCPGCPIEYFTKVSRCLGTPYYGYIRDPKVYAIAMKNFIDEIFIRSLLLIDWRKYYEVSSV